MAQNLKINDKVLILSGDNKGKEAKIVKIDRKAKKACLDGIGVIERHVRKSYTNPSGGKRTVHTGIDLSNLKLVEASKFVKSAVKKVDNSRSRAGKKTGFLSRGDDGLSAQSADKAANKKAKKGAK